MKTVSIKATQAVLLLYILAVIYILYNSYGAATKKLGSRLLFLKLFGTQINSEAENGFGSPPGTIYKRFRSTRR